VDLNPSGRHPVADCYDLFMNKASVVAALLWMGCHSVALAESAPASISLDAFSDGIKHWQDRHGKDYARY
jgi:hypothetical protein